MKMVQIEMDKTRVLKFGVKAFVEIEKVLDTKLENIDFDRQETIYALVYAGLVHQDRKLTLEKIYNIVDGMIEKKMEEENIAFMDAFAEIIGYLGEKVGEAMGNGGNETP